MNEIKWYFVYESFDSATFNRLSDKGITKSDEEINIRDRNIQSCITLIKTSLTSINESVAKAEAYKLWLDLPKNTTQVESFNKKYSFPRKARLMGELMFEEKK